MSRKGDETKKQILEAATMLFAQKGFKDVSMSDLCKQTGLSRGGLYRHYSSTAEIFSEIITDEYSFDERINNKESALAILLDTLQFVEDAILQRDRSLSLAIYEYANSGDRKEEFAVLNERAKKRWEGLIKYGMETGEFRQVDAESVAEMILYYYQGLRMWSRVVDMDEITALNYRRNILLILTGGQTR